MKFKEFQLSQLTESEIILTEASNALAKMKKFKGITDGIDIDKIEAKFKESARFLNKSTVANSKIDSIKNIGHGLSNDINDLYDDISKVKRNLETSFFDDILGLCIKMMDTIIAHVEKQTAIYVAAASR